MWRTINHEFVHISLSPEKLTCSWIAREPKKKSFVLKAFKSMRFEHREYEQSILFSPMRIGNWISAFLSMYNLQHALVTISIAGPHIVESIVDLPIASPKPTDFPFFKLQSLLWDYRYLYTKDNSRSAFYLCGIPQHILFQYKLLAIQASLNIITITTHRMALFYLYHYTKGPTFRASQLAQDMQMHNNQLDSYFSSDMLHRIVSVSPAVSTDFTQHSAHLAAAIGLFTQGVTNS